VKTRRVVIVSPHFPPSTVAAVHRARLLAKHLPKCGWEPVVVCVHEKHHKEKFDPELAELAPANLKIIKVDAWSSSICRPLGLNDVGIRGYRAMKAAVEREIVLCGADLLFITVLPGFPMLMGPSIRRKHRIPFVLDYQDPWLPRGYLDEPFGTKLWLAYRIARSVERRVIGQADVITSVSDGTNDLLRSSYSGLEATPFRAIPIGGDADDFEFLRGRERPCPLIQKSADDVTVSFVGTILPRARRTLAAVLSSLRQIREKDVRLYERLRLVFVGTANQPIEGVAKVVTPMAHELGVADRIIEVPERIPYLDALNLLVRSDLVLMMGSDEPHYTASKLYPGLLSGRPVLAIYHEGSSVCRIAESVGGVRLVKFGHGQPVETCVEDIAQALIDLCRNPRSAGSADTKMLEPYLGAQIAKQFAATFDEVVERVRA
jgi:glycosyltransferase involved in cell wall biosynthesis